ncbi:alanine racemase [Salinibacterium sp. SYSU T00001]|uniref:alanine racemase n=1 Tax=Homoserinimonas sedimenticola TaxID=2986805 RepID=UPI002235A099|nr:alanine racemase [Salinibacterium sedimenticola]MCW4385283.1 alanine racemase [Salinibacterium sedimenticola]
MREASVSLSAISANVEQLRRLADGTAAMAVVKADGYGHGAVEAARAALEGGAERLGVADIREALALREAGITAPILAWLHDPEEDFVAAAEAGIELGIGRVEQLDAVAATDASPTVHLKVDTGLGRNGVERTRWAELFERAAALEGAGRLRVTGVFSHLANAGRDEDLAQVAAFETALTMADAAGLSPELRHLAATAGAIDVPEARFDLVRLGVGIYGLSPFDERDAASLGLRPAMRVEAAVAAVKRVPLGSGVSYGLTYRTSADTTLALVPLGYADGVPRQASSSGPVLINGERFTVAGRIAMDQFVVDVGNAPVAVGDRAVLFGDPAAGEPAADDWARAAGTINYEIVTRIAGRTTRTYRA